MKFKIFYLILFFLLGKSPSAIYAVTVKNKSIVEKNYSIIQIDTNQIYNFKIYKKIIPKKIIKYIKNNFPGWQFPSPLLWKKKSFNDYKSATNLAYYATGDFNGDKKPDHVFILTNSQKQFGTWVLMSTPDNFKIIKLDVPPLSKMNYELAILRPGYYDYEVSDLPHPTPIYVQYDAIKIVFNNTVGIEYWNGNKFVGFAMPFEYKQ